MICQTAAVSLLWLTAAHAAPKTLYGFTGGADGAIPVSPMLNVNGVLYGVTSAAGTNRSGSVFAFDIATNSITATYELPSGFSLPGLVTAGPLLYANGALYGTAELAGAAEAGAIFQVNLSTATLSTSYLFQGGSDGAAPEVGVIGVKGLLVGTTAEGGGIGGGCSNFGCGTIYTFDPMTGTKVELYRFTGGANGAGPAFLSNLLGSYYGSSSYQGSATCNCGTIFRITPNGAALTTLHTFEGGSDGDEPDSPLLVVGNLFYGTTRAGGTGNCTWNGGCGTIYAINPRTGAEKVLYSFQGGKDGWRPYGNLAYLHGKLYGVTYGGGTLDCHNRKGCGTIFQFDLATKTERVLYAFRLPGTGFDTAGATITLVGNTLYGTTQASTGHYAGTIFSLTP